ncbi:MAG: hypothetical protein A3E74_04600 [Omnitrophica bacterium RIFCSPHIGHO2_12_FULL_44_12]|nr:MAG: hypothetical protein A3E74_04600 [Omnitrophica bacterium RIFCSPHIGHO2_12_FULL_44_12]
MNHLETWHNFADRCLEHKKKSVDMLRKLQNESVIAFGASARSATYLNFCGIDQSQIKAIIDNNLIKQGKFAPGTSIPIVSFDDGLKYQPGMIFILAWNFKDEIIKLCRAKKYTGKFIVAFPDEPKIIDGVI